MTHLPNRHPQSRGPSKGASVVLVMVWMMLVGSVARPDPTAAQSKEHNGPSLAERYEVLRRQAIVRRRMQREGGVQILPLEPHPTPTDSLRPPNPDRVSNAQKQSFPLETVRTVRRLERSWFRKRFGEAEWSFLGSTPHHTFFDTTRTQALRARLQAHFGDPTRTLGDAPFDTSRGARAQFEYWFVVNDSIPVRVVDPQGPRGRGLVLTAKRRYRSRLRVLRDTLLAPLRHAERAPYVDYYYDDRLERWYRTGFDGQAFFLERISHTELTPGRRAPLDTTKTSPRTSPPIDENSP